MVLFSERTTHPPHSLRNPDHIACATHRPYGYIMLNILYSESRILPHSAPSWILSKAENLASSSLQDGATKWYYFLSKPADRPAGLPSTRPPQFLTRRKGSTCLNFNLVYIGCSEGDQKVSGGCLEGVCVCLESIYYSLQDGATKW